MNQLEDRLRTALVAEAELWPDPPPAPPRHEASPVWRAPRTAIAAAAVVMLIGAGTLIGLAGTVSRGESDAVSSSSVAGFSTSEVERMPVSMARYGFSIAEWMASRESATSYSEEMSPDDLSDELVASIRAAAGGVLAEVDASPPYRATVIRAWSDSSTEIRSDSSIEIPRLWAEVVVNYADGGCFLRIENKTAVVADCSTGNNPQMSSWGVTTGGASGWVAFVWWGLPDTVVDVAYARAAGQLPSESGLAAVLGGTASLSFPTAGVEQRILLEARDAAGSVVLSREAIVPPNPDLAESVKNPTETFTYDVDPELYRDLLQGGDTFLGGGNAGGEPWAIVSRLLVVEGKPTLGCVGVRPILSEDFCDSADGIFAQVLPIGDAGVVVFGPPIGTASVRVMFSDGGVISLPVVDPGEAYPPIAVIPVERVGQSGTAVALDATGQPLFDTSFKVTDFRVPQG